MAQVVKKEYAVQDLESGLLYSGGVLGWVDNIGLSDLLDTIEDAERVISQQPEGFYAIRTVYVSAK